MRKRLSAAGYRGQVLRSILDEVVALRARTDDVGKTVLGCDPKKLRMLVGRNAYRKLVAWPVVPRVLFRDEFGVFVDGSFAELFRGSSSEVLVIQDPAQLSGAA